MRGGEGRGGEARWVQTRVVIFFSFAHNFSHPSPSIPVEMKDVLHILIN